MVQSPLTIGHYLDVTTRSCSPIIDPPIPTTEESKNNSTTIDETLEVVLEKLTFIDNNYEDDDGYDCVVKTNDNMHHGSAIAYKLLVEKKMKPRMVTILCFIGPFNIKQALCDLGVSISLMPLVIYKLLGMGTLKPRSMKLLIDDSSMKNRWVLCLM